VCKTIANGKGPINTKRLAFGKGIRGWLIEQRLDIMTWYDTHFKQENVTEPVSDKRNDNCQIN